MKHVLRILSALLVLLSLVGLFNVTASAVNWDGSAGNTGSGGNSQTANGGYSIPAVWALGYGNPNTIFGLHFHSHL